MKKDIIDTVKTKNVKISNEIIKGTYDKLNYRIFFRTIYLHDRYEYRSHLGKIKMEKTYDPLSPRPVFEWNSFVNITEEKNYLEGIHY